MNKVHLFNPENDLALALGCRHYTPPPHAAALHRAGALLPAWWADDGDSVIIPPQPSERESYIHAAEWLNSRWGLHPVIHSPSGEVPSVIPAPWGWSDDACRQFLLAGLHPSHLPGADTISTLRGLSHRRSSIAILSTLGEKPLLPVEVSDPEVALSIEATHPGCFFKSPWSCSGRGVFCAGGLPPKVIYSKAKGIIHRQGSVIVEHGYDKITDFATLFHSDGKRVTFRGLSMFITEQRGVYSGNVVASQTMILDMIYRSVRTENHTALPNLSQRILDIASALETTLSGIICPHYTGWLGIDMMIYRDTSGMIRIHPCIELNLRMTMGVVAMHIADRLSPASPRLILWQRTDTSPGPHGLLLPPRDGFALTLNDYHRP